ncbi:MAG: ABC transporter permease, partial [Acidobacteriota bacterium]|nr:ABC transporter permease [Acidobacteriota bacterium]
GINGSVLAFTLGLSLVAGLLFGLAPALQSTRFNLREPLQEGSTRSTGGVRGNRTRRLLVVSEVALALVLITGAALLIKSFAGLLGTDPGFRSAHVLTLKLSLPEAKYGDPRALDRFASHLVEQVEGLPGVQAAAMANSLPLEGGPDMPFTIEGRYTGAKSGEGVGNGQYRALTPHLLSVLGIRVERGRGFATTDTAGAPGVALINEVAAGSFFPGQDPIGQRVTMGMPDVPDLADRAPRTIVGIVHNVRERGLDEKQPPIVYIPLAQMPAAMEKILIRLLPMSLAVRGQGDVSGLAGAIEREVWAVDPQQPVTDVRTMDEVVVRSLGARRWNAVLLGILALVALVLAAVGIYGVLSYLVSQRTREIGVRVALGATAADVLRLVLGQGLSAVLLGVGIGIVGALALTRLLGSMLYGVSVTDPLTFILTPAILTAVALVASSLPAHRASRLDPLVALGHE